MQITTFERGLITNTERIVNPHETASYVRNNRTEHHGWLAPRKGMKGISSESEITDVFIHKSIILIVKSGYLKWARLNDEIGSQLTFYDLGEIQDGVRQQYRIKTGAERVVFKGQVDEEGNEGDVVWISTGKASFVVNIPGAPNAPAITGVPSARGFYLPKAKLEYSFVDNEPSGRTNRVWIRAQFVLTDGSNDVTDPDPSEAIQRKADGGSPYAPAVVFSESSDARYVDIRADAEGDATSIQIRVEGAPDGTNGYVDIYQTELNGAENGDYYFIERVPYSSNYNSLLVGDIDFSYDASKPRGSFTKALRNSDTNIGTPWGYSSQDDPNSLKSFRKMVYVSNFSPHFQHIATNKFRNYVAESNSNRVYISYYDPAEEIKLFQNFPDYIPLDLAGGAITGLAFIRDNLLVVYATNQIQLIQTDPLIELHSVIDILGPRDSDGNLIGCSAPDTIVDMGGIHYFLATNRYIYRFNGRSADSISDLVHVMFQAVVLPTTEYGEPIPSRALAFAYDKDYYISIPSLLEKGLTETPEYPNTTLLYDVQYRRWWQDGFGIRSITKSYPERLFSVINSKLFELYQGKDDDGTPIRRIWRNNPYATRPHERFESVHVYCQEAARVDIKAITEFDEYETYIDVENPEHWHDMRAGCDLRGRLHSVEISTESPTIIDRITTNEILENR